MGVEYDLFALAGGGLVEGAVRHVVYVDFDVVLDG